MSREQQGVAADPCEARKRPARTPGSSCSQRNRPTGEERAEDSRARVRSEWRGHRDMLKIEADRLPQVLSQLEASRAESRRQFEQSPVGILRCSRAQARSGRQIEHFSPPWDIEPSKSCGRAILPPRSSSPPTTFWLIAQCQKTPGKWVDSIWKRKDGSRLIMRLHRRSRVRRRHRDCGRGPHRSSGSRRPAQAGSTHGRRWDGSPQEVAETCDNLLPQRQSVTAAMAGVGRQQHRPTSSGS